MPAGPHSLSLPFPTSTDSFLCSCSPWSMLKSSSAVSLWPAFQSHFFLRPGPGKAFTFKDSPLITSAKFLLPNKVTYLQVWGEGGSLSAYHMVPIRVSSFFSQVALSSSLYISMLWGLLATSDKWSCIGMSINHFFIVWDTTPMPWEREWGLSSVWFYTHYNYEISWSLW